MSDKWPNAAAALAGVALLVWSVATPGDQMLVSSIGGFMFGWNFVSLLFGRR